MEDQQSLFDQNLKKEDLVTRSSKRRAAIILPLEKGLEITKQIQKEMESESSDLKE